MERRQVPAEGIGAQSLDVLAAQLLSSDRTSRLFSKPVLDPDFKVLLGHQHPRELLKPSATSTRLGSYIKEFYDKCTEARYGAKDSFRSPATHREV